MAFFVLTTGFTPTGNDGPRGYPLALAFGDRLLDGALASRWYGRNFSFVCHGAELLARAIHIPLKEPS